ncbi:RING finger protein 24 isoform X1 [Etheostoma cragini]|uniref:RING finger protein 24 isoform X1 n=2 Tax=Etheostoma cragini TaxID=417921 RepID=UPI00155E6DCA|nr:RING finger protein 24 isoform X1 [Etheostoma cragini]
MNGAKKGYDPDESTGGNPLTRLSRTSYVTSQEPVLQIYAYFLLFSMKAPRGMSMSSDFPHYSFRMPNIGFQNLPLNIYIVVFGTAIFVFILSLLFCCYLIRLRHQAHKELYAYKQVIQKEKVKELNLHEICAVCLEEFKQKDELGICPCKHAFHRKCLIKWLEVRKVCPLCNMPVLQLAQQAGSMDPPPPIQQPLPGVENLV